MLIAVERLGSAATFLRCDAQLECSGSGSRANIVPSRDGPAPEPEEAPSVVALVLPGGWFSVEGRLVQQDLSSFS